MNLDANPTDPALLKHLMTSVDSPAIVVDLDVVESNIRRMAGALASRGVALRPHVKTHKCIKLAQLQLAAGARGITVGTLGEAEVMAAAGIRDIFIAYPLWPAGTKASRLRDVHAQANLIVGVDSVAGAQALGTAMHSSRPPLQVAIEIDSGERRTGVQPSEAPSIATAARAAGLAVIGVFTHGGHAYAGPQARSAAAADEIRTLEAATANLRSIGFEVEMISAGSTPTALLSAAGLVTEERPGTYIFGDRQQLVLGAVLPEEIGLAVVATVVSTATAGRFVIDAGSKTLSRDRPHFLVGHGLIAAVPDVIVSQLYDYHGVVDVPAWVERPRVGTLLEIVPNHVCPVVNLADELVVVRSGRLIARWPVDARGRTA